MSIDETTSKLFRQGKYNSLKWVPEEKVLQFTRNYRENVFDRYKFSLTAALFLKYKKSVLGTYLDIFNLAQKQDKPLNENKLSITKWDIQRYSENKLKLQESRNDIFDDYMKVLNDAVTDCDIIDLDYIKDITTRIELTSIYINLADADLKKFTNVRILVLLGNNLRELSGSCLPRRLLYLELYDNFISDIKSLVKGAPNHLLHLGLGRNKITDDSSLYLLAESCQFERLQNLDLSSNAIYKLEAVMTTLTTLKSLSSFSLEGNPCAVAILYRDIVLHYLPFLQYLDNVEVLTTDHDKQEAFSHGCNQAQIVFKCYRILGLPKPPNDKKSIQTIHVEVEFPLMEEVHFPKMEIPVVVKSSDGDKKEETRYIKDSKSKKSNTTATKETGNVKKQSPYSKPTEYDEMDEENNYYFKSVRMPWNKIIEFPPIFIESPEKDLASVRDTFRSIVNVRVVYLKVSKPGQNKKGGKKEKPSKHDKRARDIDLTHSEENIKPKETVLKKVTLCSFFCHLRDVSWSEETVDFYWVDHSTFNADAFRVDGCLKDIKYTDKKEKKTKPTKGKKEIASASVSAVDVNVLNPLPKFLTCQVGFGLKRNMSLE